MTYNLLSGRKRILCGFSMWTVTWNWSLGAVWLQLKGVWYRSPVSLGRAPLRPHPVVLFSWSLDLLTVRMAEFLLQEINSVKDIFWWGRGKGKSYHKIVFPKSVKFLWKRKGAYYLLSESTGGEISGLHFGVVCSDSFTADRRNLVI